MMPEPDRAQSAGPDELPRPKMPDAAVGTMPTAAMPEGEPGARMPPGETPGETAEGAMPVPNAVGGGMSEPEGLGGMPAVALGGHEAQGEPRFPPAVPQQEIRGMWEPGRVEVEFRDDIRPQLAPTLEQGAPAIESRAALDLDSINEVFRRHRIQRVEPSVDTPLEEADRAQAAALRADPAMPNLGSFFTLQFPPTADIERIASELSQLPEVERAVPVPKAVPPAEPEDEPLVGDQDTVVLDPLTGLENQWYVHRCRVDRAWSRATGQGVVIADIDWGYRTTHEDLEPRFDMGRAYNSYDGGSVVDFGEFIDHGTGVMGHTGAAVNDKGMAGFAHKASLWPIQANDGPGSPVSGNAWAQAIEHVRLADSDGARKVIILEVQTGSFGNYEMVPSVNAAIRTAIADGVVVCVAAGNGDRDAGLDDHGNPIPETGSILVGATAYHAASNQRWRFSNYGPRIVVSAPGDSSHDLTCSSIADTAYRNTFGGTSGATPKVAGTAALLLEVDPNLTHGEIRDILRQTGSTVVTGPDKPVGTFLDADAAVIEVVQRKTSRLDVFVRGHNRAVWEKMQTAPNNGWSGYSSLGGWIDRLAVSQNSDGRLEIFARGSDKALWHKWQTAPSGAWSGWMSKGGWIDRVAAGRNFDGRLEVFARGGDRALWHRWQTSPGGAWSGWASLGGWINDITVSNNEDGRLEVFVRGSDSALWHKWQTTPGGGWSGWASLGGWIDLTAVERNEDGRLEVFARGSDKGLWHKWQTA
ncbi:MAG: S8 family serine peptidase, partial [Gemmatimonadales bacterium]|nr:S8 family serine peptidase [Gemmatimonadales bacterium]